MEAEIKVSQQIRVLGKHCDYITNNSFFLNVHTVSTPTAKRKTATAMGVVFALKRQGRTLSEDISSPLTIVCPTYISGYTTGCNQEVNPQEGQEIGSSNTIPRRSSKAAQSQNGFFQSPIYQKETLLIITLGKLR